MNSWLYIPRYHFKRYGGLNFLLRCNYDNPFIKQIDLPPFYKEILLHMLELKQLYGYYQNEDLVLFNNREILINGKSFYHNEWHQQGIFSIRDVLSDEGKFLSYQEFVQKYNLKCNFLRYFQVLSAIPKNLRD